MQDSSPGPAGSGVRRPRMDIETSALRGQLAATVITVFDTIPDCYSKYTFPLTRYITSSTMILLGLAVKHSIWREKHQSCIMSALQTLCIYCQKNWVSGTTIRTITQLNRIASSCYPYDSVGYVPQSAVQDTDGPHQGNGTMGDPLRGRKRSVPPENEQEGPNAPEASKVAVKQSDHPQSTVVSSTTLENLSHRRKLKNQPNLSTYAHQMNQSRIPKLLDSAGVGIAKGVPGSMSEKYIESIEWPDFTCQSPWPNIPSCMLGGMDYDESSHPDYQCNTDATT